MLWKLQTLESGIHEFKALFCHWTSWVTLSKLLFSFFSCKIEIISISTSWDGCDDCMRRWMFREFPVSPSFPPTSTVCRPLRPDFSWQSVLTPNTVNNRKERLSPTHLRFPDVPPYYSQAFIYILPDTNYTVLLWTKSQHMKLLMALPIWLAILVSTLLLHGPISLQLQKSVIPSWFFCQTLSGQWPGHIGRWTGNTTGKFPSGFDFCRRAQELPWRTGLLSLLGHLPLLPENPGLTNL